MTTTNSLLQKTGWILGLSTFLFTHAYSHPSEIPTLAAGYGNTETGGTSGQDSSGPVTPHSYQKDMTGQAPHSDGPAVASEADTLGDYSPETPSSENLPPSSE